MLSVVIPVYNESRRLRSSLDQVLAHLGQHHGSDWELIVSDDGSEDDSVAIAESYASDTPQVRIVRGERNEGKGAAVSRGMLAARGQVVFFCDADLSTPLEEIERFLEVFERDPDVSVVIGTRKHPDAKIERPQPWYRVWLGLGYTRLVHRMTGTSFSDYTCGFKAFRSRCIEPIFSRSRLRGWSFDAEILFLAQRRGDRVHEVPVRWIDEPDSRVRLLRALWRSYRELCDLRRNAQRGLYDEPRAP